MANASPKDYSPEYRKKYADRAAMLKRSEKGHASMTKKANAAITAAKPKAKPALEYRTTARRPKK